MKTLLHPHSEHYGWLDNLWKSSPALLLLLAVPLLSQGQGIIHNPGLVNFSNTEAVRPAGTPTTFHFIYKPGTLQPLVGTQYVAELYYLDPASNSLMPLPASVSNFKDPATSQPGTWDDRGFVRLPAGIGGVDVLDDLSAEAGDGSGTGPGYYPVTLRVRIWDSTTGNSWETTPYRAETASFQYTQRYTLSSTDTMMINQPGLAVPEPSVIALSLLAITSILVCRPPGRSLRRPNQLRARH